MEKRQKQDAEALLAQGHTIQIHPQGYSMYPLFLPGRDEAVVAPLREHRFRRGDVLLYRREGSILVLHRVWRCQKDGLYMVGDHQSEVEGPLKEDCIRGILTGVVRNGHYFSAKHPVYRVLSDIWLRLRPVRPYVLRVGFSLRSLGKVLERWTERGNE